MRSESDETADTADRRRRRKTESKDRSNRNSPPHPGKTQNFVGKLDKWIVGNPTAILLLVVITLAFSLEAHQIPLRVTAFIPALTVFILFGYLFFQGLPGTSLAGELKTPPNAWIAAYFVWSLFCAVYRPHYPGLTERTLVNRAYFEMLRLVFGIGVYFTAAYYLRVREAASAAVLIIGVAAAVALSAIIVFGNSQQMGAQVTAFYQGHEQLGTLVMLPLFMAVSLAMDKNLSSATAIFCQVCAWILLTCLLLCETRSAWAGAALGTIPIVVSMFAKLDWSDFKRHKYAWIGIPAVTIFGVFLLIADSPLTSSISKRFNTVLAAGEDVSLQNRLLRWHAAAQMTHARPFTGWGLGSFPVLQHSWTGFGMTPISMMRYGVGHLNLAHNFYVQLSAEVGTVGLAIFVAINVSFILVSMRNFLNAGKTSHGKMLLLGSVASLFAACGDMVSSPSYSFLGESTLPWLWMGLGVAASRSIRQDTNAMPQKQSLPSSRNLIWTAIVPITTGICVSAVIYVIGSHPNAYR